MRPLPCFFFFSSGALLTLAVMACGSSDATNPGPRDDAALDASTIPPPRPPTADEDSSIPKDAGFTGPTTALPAAAAQMAGAACDYMQRCWPAYIDEHVGSLAACKTGSTLVQEGRHRAGAVFGTAALNAATTCFATISCDSLYGNVVQTKCAFPAPVNGGALGAQCNKADDCGSGRCAGNTKVACGACAATVTLKVGDTCGVSAGTVCPAGSACLGKCVLEQGLNDPCDGDLATIAGTKICGSGLKCTASTCVKAGAAGAACTKSLECDPFQLALCDKVAGQCATVEMLALGAACKSSDVLYACGKGLRCLTPAGSADGTCQLPLAAGAACNAVGTDTCVFGYDCNGTCVAPGSDRPVCK